MKPTPKIEPQEMWAIWDADTGLLQCIRYSAHSAQQMWSGVMSAGNWKASYEYGDRCVPVLVVPREPSPRKKGKK